MRHYILIVLAFLLLVIESDCRKEEKELPPLSPYDNVGENVELFLHLCSNDYYSSSELIWIQIENKSKEIICYTDEFWVEQLTEDRWHEKTINPVVWASDIKELEPGEHRSFGLLISQAVTSLPAGIYRIVKEVWQKGEEEIIYPIAVDIAIE